MTESREYTGVSGKYTKNGMPNGFTSITPFITVKNPSEAIEFYTTVFNARVKDITEYPDENGNKIIVHAELDFGNGFCSWEQRIRHINWSCRQMKTMRVILSEFTS